MIKSVFSIIFIYCISLVISVSNVAIAKKNLPRIDAVLTSAPHVPPPANRNYSANVVVKLETIEVTKELDNGIKYQFWTFGGSVPGKFIRVRQDDIVEFHLINNKDSKLPHNIDLHAVTGPGGGAAVTNTLPGKVSIFSFKALNPGLYVYHCATPPVPLHIANGMYGLILVDPIKSLPKADKEYYVMQSEFYTENSFGTKGLQSFSQEKAVKEIPDYVVFNGAVGAVTDTGALTANVGDTVRIYFGNGGPNLISSFHVIGAVFDDVYTEAGSVANHNVQTTLVPAGGAVIVDFKVKVPGNFVLVDHSIFRAFNKGAVGILKVSGPANSEVFAERK